MKYDIYNLTSKMGGKTRLTVPAGTHDHHMLTKGICKILSKEENIEIDFKELKNERKKDC